MIALPAFNPARRLLLRVRQRACARGVTLIELMVVLVLIAILLTIGVPSYQSFTTSNRMSGELNNLLGDLQYARAEAIKLGRPVVVCTSSDGATCTGASNWMVGRIVYADANNDGTVQASEILRVQPALTSTDTFTSDGGTSQVAFNREGFVTTAPLVTFTLHDAANTASQSRCLAVARVGQFVQQKPGQGACT